MDWFNRLSTTIKNAIIIFSAVTTLTGFIGGIANYQLEKKFATLEILHTEISSIRKGVENLGTDTGKLQFSSSIIAYKYLGEELKKYDVNEVKNESFQKQYIYLEMHALYFEAGQRIGKISPDIKYREPF